MQIFFYNKEVEHFIEKLEKQTIAKVLRSLDLLERFGNDLNMPHSKSIGGGLFELRVRGIQEVRFLYTFRKEEVVIVLSGFIKKNNKISQKELIKARSRKKRIDLT